MEEYLVKCFDQKSSKIEAPKQDSNNSLDIIIGVTVPIVAIILSCIAGVLVYCSCKKKIQPH